MPSQSQVLGFERDFAALASRYDDEKQKIIEANDGDFNEAVMDALRKVCARQQLELALLRIEWGME